MMLAGYHVGDDFRVLRIRNARLQNADYGGRALIDERTEPDGLAEHGRIAIQRGRPETIGQDDGARGLRTIVVRIQQPAEHGTQPHDLEIRPSHHPSLNRARFSEANQSKTYGGEIAERTQ